MTKRALKSLLPPRSRATPLIVEGAFRRRVRPCGAELRGRLWRTSGRPLRAARAGEREPVEAPGRGQTDAGRQEPGAQPAGLRGPATAATAARRGRDPARSREAE